MKTCFLYGMIVLLSGSAFGQSPPEVFDSANRLYQEGRFPEAKDRYESILANGYESSALYLNLGNTYFRMGNIARAILNYERGLRLAPGDEELQFNQSLAGMMTIDRIESTPRLFIWDYWDGLKSGFSLQGVFWSAYSAYVLIFVLLSVLMLSDSFTLRRIALIGSIAMTAAFLLLLTVGVARYSDLSRTNQAVIVSEIVSVKNSPDGSSTDAFVLHGGTKVQITDHVGTWLQIRLADGKVGWVEAGAAEVI